MALADYGTYLHGDFVIERKFAIRDRLVVLAALSKPSDILDVGCGRGLIAIGFARSCASHRIEAIDVWNQDEIPGNDPEWVLENARREGASNIKVKYGDAREIPYESDRFDLVVSNLVIHNLPEQEQLKACFEMHRTLKPGGLLLYSDVDGDHQIEKVTDYLSCLDFVSIEPHLVLASWNDRKISVRALMATKR